MAREGQLAREIRAGLEDEQVVANMNGASNRVPSDRTAASAEGMRVLSEVKNPISATSGMPNGNESVGLLDQRYFGKPKRHHVKEFGCLFGAIFSGVAAYLIHYGKYDPAAILIGLTVLFVASGYKAPILLYPIWSAWMTFAHGLGVVMSFLFVAITWVVMAVPLAFLLRLIGKKVMDLSFDRSVESYWEEREDKLHDFKLLERQF